MTSLIHSLPNQRSDASTEQLLNVLTNIVSKIQIQSDFCISHPDYQFQLPNQAIVRFQRQPEEIQQKYRHLHLSSFLYGIYYNGSMQTNVALNGETKRLALDLENDTFLGVDSEFYHQIHQSNSGTGYFDPGWQILGEGQDGSLAVIKRGFRLQIEREKHLQSVQQSATVGDLVAVRMPENMVQNGFYIAVSNVGIEGRNLDVTVYFNFSPEGAVAVMHSLTRRLNAIPIFFNFKVLYNPKDYGRCDAGFLYFEKENYETIRPILESVYKEHQEHFQTEIPLFTKLLAPGLGLAMEPNNRSDLQESFGMNRCQIVANGLLEAWYKGENSSEARMNSIFEQFSRLNLDWQRAYLNANAEDIYAPLNLL